MHSTHAHPLPDGRNPSSSSNRSIGPTHNSSAITSPATLASQQQNEGLSHQTRRLQLRNAGFRGAIFPTRRISPLFTTTSAVESMSRQVGNENSPLNAEKRSMYGEDLPPSPVNILQEIQKSTRKKRSSPRPGFGAIFQDKTQTENLSGASETSWYKEGSRNSSPAALAETPIDMTRLREGSGNQKTPPPLSSPLTKQMKGRNPRHIHFRSASSETSRYIEHLESQLASANAKLDSLTSPDTNKLRSAKLRALTVENRNLRQDISAWEKLFATRVQEDRDQLLEAEMELRVRLRTLENDIELKDARIAELEWEAESMRAKVGNAEGLEEVNIGLEKRIEILTNLLAYSPNKIDVCSAAATPVRADPIKRTPRPKSMLPRIPSPSGGARLSLSTVSESAFWQPNNIGSSTSIVESPDDAVQDIDGQDLRSPTYDERMQSPGYRRQSRQSGSFEIQSRRSDSFRSAPVSASRPTSFRSSGSFGPTSWGLPHLADVDVRSANKQRKMRKFPSGSVSLRPLILPAATIVPSLPASAPIYPSTESTARQGVSEGSPDPITSFLSKTTNSSPATTPSQHGPHGSASWAQEQTLKALEGRFTDVETLNDEQAPRSITLTAEEKMFGFEEISSEDRKRRRRPRSLQKELEKAEREQAGQAQAVDASELFEDGLIPVDVNESSEESPESGQYMKGIDPTPSKAPLSAANSRQQRSHVESENTPKPEKKPSPLAPASSQPIKSTPSTLLTTQHAFGIFSRLTTLVFQAKQDPVILARRILSNAWAHGSKRLGGIGWWLLGLVYGTRWRKRKRTADSGIVEPTTTQDFGWQHFTAEASRRSTAEYYFRDYGTCHQSAAHWLSPPHASAQRIPSSIPTPLSNPSTKPRHEPHLFPCTDCVEPSSRRTFRLWFRFSLAIVIAVGMAIRHGPASLLSEDPEPTLPTHTHESFLPSPKKSRTHSHEREPLLQTHRSRSNRRRSRNSSSGDAGLVVDYNADTTSLPSSRVNSVESSSTDSGYGSITFAETLGPADFEAVC